MTGLWKGGVPTEEETFLANRQFRVYFKLDIPPNTSLFIRHTTTKNITLHDQRIVLKQGEVEWQAMAAVTASDGPWTAKTMRRRNQQSLVPAYTSGSVLEFSTTATAITGGTEVDYMNIAAGSGGQSSSVSQNAGKRGLAPNQYHTKLFNPGNQNAKGVYDWWWEEID